METENEVQSDPNNDNPEHAIRDDKPINSLDKLDDAIKNPSRIVDFEGVRRYLIKKYDSGRVVIFALNKNKNPVFNKVVMTESIPIGMRLSKRSATLTRSGKVERTVCSSNISTDSGSSYVSTFTMGSGE